MNRLHSIPAKLLGATALLMAGLFVLAGLITVWAINPMMRSVDEQNALDRAQDTHSVFIAEMDTLRNVARGIGMMPIRPPEDGLPIGREAESMMRAMDIDILGLAAPGGDAAAGPVLRRNGRSDAGISAAAIGAGIFPEIDSWTIANIPDGFGETLLVSAPVTGHPEFDRVVVGKRLETVFTPPGASKGVSPVRWNIKPVREEDKTVSIFLFPVEVSSDPVSARNADVISRVDRIDVIFRIPIPDTHQALEIDSRVPTTVSIERDRRINRTILIPLSGLTLIGIFVVLWAFRAISVPIRQLIRGIEEWDGVRLPDLDRLTARQDEIGVLARAFRKMAGDVRSKTRSLEDLSVRDGLTGLFNRRRFDEMLDREFKRHQRTGESLALIMADIDSFKSYNDTYGHPAGDECIRLVARACGRGIRRPGDHSFRYGGEEFALILADTDMDGVTAVAESIRSTVEGLALDHEHSPHGKHITMSFGVAVSEKDSDEGKMSLLNRADAALFEAKKNGRNRVESG